MTTIDTLEARVAELEARLAPSPLAANPPITVGELTDVPAPGSPIASAWSQEVSNRIAHRFATLAALNAWAAANGSIGVVGRDLYLRVTGAWVQQRVGMIGAIQTSYTLAVASAYIDIPGAAVNWTAIPGRSYRATIIVAGSAPATGPALVRGSLNVVGGAGRMIDNVISLAASGYGAIPGQAIITGNGAMTATVQAWTDRQPFAMYHVSLVVEDLGVQ